MPQTPTTVSKPLEIGCSRYFLSWFQEQKVSLVFTTYQTNRLFLVGVNNCGKGTDKKKVGLFHSQLRRQRSRAQGVESNFLPYTL